MNIQVVNSATNFVNHVVFVLDKSGSMSYNGLDQPLIKLFDEQVEHLCQTSKANGQETRVSVFLFGSDVECVIYDTDVLRVPSIRNLYQAHDNSTALIGGTLQSIYDMKLLSQKYGDHAFLFFVMTDGGENVAPYMSKELKAEFQSLPSNFTVGCLVPDILCKANAQNFGFPAENIMLWDTTKTGIDKLSETFKKTTENFMRGRSQGIRQMHGGMFKADLSKIDKKEVQKTLAFIPFRDFLIKDIDRDIPIQEYVEQYLQLPFVKGKGYYLLMKAETIQGYKEICVRDRRNGNVYTGANARQLIGLPDTDTRVKPEGCGDYEVFVQSTSNNRKLIKGTRFLYLTK